MKGCEGRAFYPGWSFELLACDSASAASHRSHERLASTEVTAGRRALPRDGLSNCQRSVRLTNLADRYPLVVRADRIKQLGQALVGCTQRPPNPPSFAKIDARLASGPGARRCRDLT